MGRAEDWGNRRTIKKGIDHVIFMEAQLIFLIPARAGSKRLPGKNKRNFCGLPLWMWSLATARRICTPSDAIEVSSDDPEIYRIAGCRGRSRAMAQDDSLVADLVDLYIDDDDVCLLQPTSPTRTDELVRFMLSKPGSNRSVTNGEPNGQCYVYRKGMPMRDIETDLGHDINTLAEFEEAETWMMEKFK